MLAPRRYLPAVGDSHRGPLALQTPPHRRPAPGSERIPGAQGATSRKSFGEVARDGLGVALASGLSGFAFGVTAVGSGFSVLQTCVLSFGMFTGASQYALISALAAGGNPFTAAVGGFFLALRNVFYGLRLSQLLALPPAVRFLAAPLVIDEGTAVALLQPDRRTARLGFLTTGITLYVLWGLSSWVGAIGAGAIPDTAAWGMDAAGPAVFLALLVPMLKSTTERTVAVVAATLGLGLLPALPIGVPVLMAALAAPAVLGLQKLAPHRLLGRRGHRPV